MLTIMREAEFLVIAGEDPRKGIVAQPRVIARALSGQLAQGHTHLVGTTILDIHFPGMQSSLEGGSRQGIGPVIKALWAICIGLRLLGIEGQGPLII